MPRGAGSPGLCGLIARAEPAVADRPCRGLGPVVVTLHDVVALDGDLAHHLIPAPRRAQRGWVAGAAHRRQRTVLARNNFQLWYTRVAVDR